MSKKINWFKDSKYIKDEVKTLSVEEAAYSLREAWKRLYNKYPSNRTLATLLAKSCLETGWWKHIHCYNFGNIKRKDNETFTMFECGEEVSLATAQKLIKESPELVSIKRTYSWSNGQKRASVNILPGHPWSQFRAHNTALEGAVNYLEFVSKNTRYKKAWKKLVKGDPKGYSIELGKAGYYTASPEKYTKGVMKLFNKFLGNMDKLISWKPKEIKKSIDSTINVTEQSEAIDLSSSEEVMTLIPDEFNFFDYELEEEISNDCNNIYYCSESEEEDEEFKPEIHKKKLKRNDGFASVIVLIISAGAFILSIFESCQ